ncbi:PucR family transcriptional regulator [Pimelobacter simplex]|uniref:Putative regulatory protein n=3 Tax=Nocardioides simplex TaxID=2045 RepID=A0A0A1DJC7_NOCSI|nr:PucR family transcriptional regulator [Pimelobacter simplex]AIY16772.1 putative regulatory protein [Pimelobacter simplex]GEB15642.1 CdaR family transcriptional regulator [Pimelobacter simplex]SFM57218.1 purine catabolism regulatory protein [Pimelobacter simplex]
MLPTLREVLATPVLSAADAEVVAGADQLDRPVRWLHPAEVADIASLLRGDEVVLTNGLFLGDDADEIHRYVGSLTAAGVAGLVLELGRRWPAVPAALVEACREHSLALVALHREVRFAAVVEEVGARIHDAQVEDLRAIEQLHDDFTRLDLAQTDAAAILRTIARVAQAPVVLESFRHQVLGFDLARGDHSGVLGEWSRRSREVTTPGRTGYDRRSGWLTTVVGTRGDDWGRLVLITEGLPRRRDYVLVERAAATLALQQLVTGARDGLERGTHAALLAELRAGRITPELLVRCEASHLPVTGCRLFAVAVRGRVEPGAPGVAAPADLGGALAGAARDLGLPVLVGVEADHAVGLVSLAPGRAADAAMQALVRALRGRVAVTVARGEVVGRIEDAPATLVGAEHVLAATESDDPRPWTTLADVHVRGLVHLLRDDERLQAFAGRELGPLLAHDADRGTSLTDLLRVYLESRGGKAGAAKSLLVSRPVLYERLARIEAVLGVDLEDPQIRTSLHLALLARASLDELPGSPATTDTT